MLRSRRALFFIVLIVLMLAIPVTLYLLSQRQDIRQRASEGDPSILATIDGQPVTESEVRSFADQMYKTPPTDQSQLQASLNQLIEQRLVESTVAQANIQVTDGEVAAQIAEDGLSAYASDPGVQQSAKLSVMKRKIELQFTKTRSAFTVGFWLPPANYGVSLTPDQQQLLTSQRQAAPDALAEILTQMKAGGSALVVAKAVVQQYPSLDSVMAVNGLVLSKTTDEAQMTSPLVYSFQKSRENLAFFKTLFSLSPGQIALVEDSATSDGGVVISVTGATDGQFDNYSAWFANQKAQHVVIK